MTQVALYLSIARIILQKENLEVLVNSKVMAVIQILLALAMIYAGRQLLIVGKQNLLS